MDKGSTLTKGIAEIDLSGTSFSTYSEVGLMAGGILFYDGGTGILSYVQVKNVFTNMDGGREGGLRYTTPRRVSENALLGVYAYRPMFSLNSKNYPRNIIYMPPGILRVCLDLSENCYSRAAS